MKKFIGHGLIIISSFTIIALIPLLIWGDSEILPGPSNSMRPKEFEISFITGNLIFAYLVILSILISIYRLIENYKVYFHKDISRTYITIANLIFWFTIFGGGLGLIFPKEVMPCYGGYSSNYCYYYNYLVAIAPTGLAIFISLIIFGVKLSKD